MDGGVITDSDDQLGTMGSKVPMPVPSVSTAPDVPATATVPRFHRYPQFQMHQLSPRFPRYPQLQMHQLRLRPPFWLPRHAGSSMGPPAVAVPQIKYAARPGEGRLLDYASSLRLVSMSAPRFRRGPYGATTTSSAAASSGGPPKMGGPITVLAWDQFSTASLSGLSPQEYAALNRMPMGSSEPEVREWPKFLRVRVGGDLNYTKVLTGNAAKRSAGCLPLDYRPAPEIEASTDGRA